MDTRIAVVAALLALASAAAGATGPKGWPPDPAKWTRLDAVADSFADPNGVEIWYERSSLKKAGTDVTVTYADAMLKQAVHFTVRIECTTRIVHNVRVDEYDEQGQLQGSIDMTGTAARAVKPRTVVGRLAEHVCG